MGYYLTNDFEIYNTETQLSKVYFEGKENLKGFVVLILFIYLYFYLHFTFNS